jgi:hypothetical protein
MHDSLHDKKLNELAITRTPYEDSSALFSDTSHAVGDISAKLEAKFRTMAEELDVAPDLASQQWWDDNWVQVSPPKLGLCSLLTASRLSQADHYRRRH